MKVKAAFGSLVKTVWTFFQASYQITSSSCNKVFPKLNATASLPITVDFPCTLSFFPALSWPVKYKHLILSLAERGQDWLVGKNNSTWALACNRIRRLVFNHEMKAGHILLDYWVWIFRSVSVPLVVYISCNYPRKWPSIKKITH